MQNKGLYVDALHCLLRLVIYKSNSNIKFVNMTHYTSVSLLLSCFLIRYAGTVIYRIFTCPFSYARKSVDSDSFFTKEKRLIP